MTTNPDCHSKLSPFLWRGVHWGSAAPQSIPDSQPCGLEQTFQQFSFSIWNMGTPCSLWTVKYNCESCRCQDHPTRPEHLQYDRGAFVKRKWEGRAEGSPGVFVGSERLKLRDVKWATQGPPARGRGEGVGMLLRCLQAPCPRGWHWHDSPVLSAGDAFQLPVRINAPGLTQCMLECMCTYTLKSRLGRQRGPGKRAQPQAGLQVELWRSSLQRRQGCHSSEEWGLARGTGREICCLVEQLTASTPPLCHRPGPWTHANGSMQLTLTLRTWFWPHPKDQSSVFLLPHLHYSSTQSFIQPSVCYPSVGISIHPISSSIHPSKPFTESSINTPVLLLPFISIQSSAHPPFHPPSHSPILSSIFLITSFPSHSLNLSSMYQCLLPPTHPFWAHIFCLASCTAIVGTQEWTRQALFYWEAFSVWE